MELGYGSTSTEYGYLKNVIESLVGTGGGGSYGIFISNMPQHNQGQINIEDTDPPNTNGVDLNDFDDGVVIENEGTYNIQYRIQFVSTSQNIGEAYIHLERGVNGVFTPIANSSSVYTIAPSVVVDEDGPLSSAVGNFIVNCNAGDEIALVWASANQNISISHDADETLNPANPSVILTVQEVTGRGPPGPAGGPPGPQGLPGPQGPPGPGNMDWINTYLINAPPAITFLPAVLQSTIVYIAWTNYNQINAGFMGYLPVATSFRANVTSNDAYTTGNVVVASPYNLDAKGPNLPANGLSGVVLYQTGGVNEIANITFPNQVTRRSYRIFNVQLNNAGNTIVASYSNFFNGNNNPITLTFGGYTQSGPPSVVREVVLTITGSQTADLDYRAPASVDVTNDNSTLTIIGYQIIYSTPGSTVRFGGPIEQAQQTVNIGNVTTYNAIGLFPDSPYTFNISAQNSATLFSPPVAAGIQTTRPLTAIVLGNLGFQARYFPNTVYRIGTQPIPQNAISTLVNSSANWISNIVAPIQNVNNRGTLAPQGTIMTLSASLNNGAGPAVHFGRFGSVLPGANTVNNITITPNGIVDSYALNAPQFQGFYQNVNATLTIGTNAFVASGSVYTFQVTDSGILAPGVNQRSLTYYYDGTYNNNAAPTGTLVYNITTPTQTFVSGVNVMGGRDTTIQYTATLTNMGRYFYRVPYFTMTSNVNLFNPTSPVLNDITDGYNNTTQEFTNTITLTNATIETNPFATLYTNVISITTASAFNAVGAGIVTNNTGNIGVVIDGPSFNLINNVIPRQIPTITNVNTIGCRCYSAPGGVAGTPPFITAGGQSYSQILYNQEWDISSQPVAGGVDARAEIMVANGRFTTPGGVTPNPYKDYRIYFNNTAGVDYSGILPATGGYRYATFVWRVPESGGLSYSNLRIILNGITGGGGLDFNGVNNVVSIGVNPLRIFYRFENLASLAPADTGAQNFTTVWADGNSVTGTNFTSTTYFQGTFNDVKWGLIGLPGTDQFRTFLNFNVSMPPLIVGNGVTEYLYCRIGLPMAANIAYAHVSALLTTQ